MEATAVMRNYAPPEPFILIARDCFLYDEDGRAYADFQAAYSANNAGNSNARVTGANQLAASLTSILSRARRSRHLPLAARELQQALGIDYKLLPTNGGCEAIESAVLLAKLVFNRHPRFAAKRERLAQEGRRPKVAVCANNFHGRSSWAKAASSNPAYRDPFAPNTLEAELVKVPFGDAAAFAAAVQGGDVSVFAVEPIQCEGGMNVPPADYFREVRRRCDQHDVLLVMDEVQTGLGRTGRMLAQEHYFGGRVEADFIALAKSLSGGQEVVSAVLARPEYADLVRPSEHGSTFGGGPKAALTMRAAVREILDRRLCDLAEDNGHLLRRALRTIAAGVPDVLDVRGVGLAVGIEMKGHAADEVCACLRECPFLYRGREIQGCWTNATHGITDETTVVRVSPPLTMPTELMMASMFAFAQALGHPNPEVFRNAATEAPKTKEERQLEMLSQLHYLTRRLHRFRTDFAARS